MEVYTYSEKQLADALTNAYTPRAVIQGKRHFKYLTGYLGKDGLHAKTIVLEPDYISRDYLHDYAAYYVFCFEPYPKTCKRVHFFNRTFTKKQLQSALLNDTSKAAQTIWDAYLGYIVVKPIPVTVIGYTLLRTYSHDPEFGTRNFWGTREYKVHFFGKQLTMESLAFMEQDTVVAACATTAIWSMLSKASIDHYTNLKSPIEITQGAGTTANDGSRLFPNHGLSVLQISQAMYSVGMVSEVKQPDYALRDKNGQQVGKVMTNLHLKKIVNAYSHIGIPLILILSVPHGDAYGLHAVTVSGFVKKAPEFTSPQKETRYLAANIDKLYAHDDQWGPFAKILFLNDTELSTPWTLHTKQQNPSYCTHIVVPLFPKIRISYEDINVITLGLDTLLTMLFENSTKADLVWDIKLMYSEAFKSEVRTAPHLTKPEKLAILTENLPKYLWQVSCYVEDTRIMDFTFDATDVKNGMIGRHVLCYLPKDLLKKINEFLVLNRKMLMGVFRHPESSVYYDFLVGETGE